MILLICLWSLVFVPAGLLCHFQVYTVIELLFYYCLDLIVRSLSHPPTHQIKKVLGCTSLAERSINTINNGKTTKS